MGRFAATFKPTLSRISIQQLQQNLGAMSAEECVAVPASCQNMLRTLAATIQAKFGGSTFKDAKLVTKRH